MIERDERWIASATLEELKDAILDEPPNSPLFKGETGKLFWTTYRGKVGQMYGTQLGGEPKD